MSLTAQRLADLMPDATEVESNAPAMESSLHYAQLALLVSCLEWLWRDQDNFFIGATLTIYFSRQQLKTDDFKGLDFFLVQHVQQRPRKSWVVWEEGGKYPDLIIELLSDSTAETDRTLKKRLYQDRFRTYEYFWFSPKTPEFEGLRLISQQYEPIPPNPFGWRWSETLDLYLGVQDGQLRYFDAQEQLIPTPEEQAAQVQHRAEQLAAQLRSLGVAPEV
jgi:Uma2 family endonuclease